MRRALSLALLLGVTIGAVGCHHPSVTAIPLSPWNRCEPEGIPFYLPKPLLVVAKNVRHIPEANTGQMGPAPIPDSFDHQEGYADVKAHMSYDQPESSGAGKGAGKESGLEAATGGGPTPSAEGAATVPALPSDELVSPETFYTYQLIFVPDLSQKYGLRVQGGPGEIRAAMNLVNGWMFTGLGPYYMKDSSTAQNLIAGGISIDLAGRGVAQVIKSIADLKGLPGGGRESAIDAKRVAPLVSQLRELNLLPQPIVMAKYAEIYIYEPTLNPDGSMSWNRIIDHTFDREIIGTVAETSIQGNPNQVSDAVDCTPQAPATGGTKPQVPPNPAPGQEPSATPKAPSADLPSHGQAAAGGSRPVGAAAALPSPARDPLLARTSLATRWMADEVLRQGEAVREARVEASRSWRESGLESARVEAETKRDLALAALGLAPSTARAGAPALEAGVPSTATGQPVARAAYPPPDTGQVRRGFFGRFHHRKPGSLIERRRVLAGLNPTSADDNATARAVTAEAVRGGTPPPIAPARVSANDPEAFRRVMP